MEYKGRYKIFTQSLVKTYSLDKKHRKVSIKNFIKPECIEKLFLDVPKDIEKKIISIVNHIARAKEKDKPVMIFSGAHLVKNGLSLLLIDLIKRDIITFVSGNGAIAIHDFEIALLGKTSEDVVKTLPMGKFGMAYEFNYINKALAIGNDYSLGLGESLGKMICDSGFCSKVLSQLNKGNESIEFLYPEISLLATCYKKKVPFTIHAGIGTDVTDQQPSFDGEAKGGCSARDFLIYTNEITKISQGGVILNIGSAVTGPEVLLKATSMAANIGKAPKKIITADFDIREEALNKNTEESNTKYYYRDQKSVVNRIPQAFGGKGYYVQGNQIKTFPLLYKKIIERIFK